MTHLGMPMSKTFSETCALSGYEVVAIASGSEAYDYEALIESIYRPLGFLQEEKIKIPGCSKYLVKNGDDPVATFCLSKSRNKDIFSRHLEFEGDLLEVNNATISKSHRGHILLAIIMYTSAMVAYENNFDIAAGITRYQALPYFVDYGVTPLAHDPLHLLDDANILDFIVYYRLDTEAAISYMHERTKRYFAQKLVMSQIRDIVKTRQEHRGRTERVAAQGQA